MINFRLDSRLGVMAPMATFKNTASGFFSSGKYGKCSRPSVMMSSDLIRYFSDFFLAKYVTVKGCHDGLAEYYSYTLYIP